MYYTDITLTLPGGAQRQLLLRRPQHRSARPPWRTVGSPKEDQPGREHRAHHASKPFDPCQQGARAPEIVHTCSAASTPSLATCTWSTPSSRPSRTPSQTSPPSAAGFTCTPTTTLQTAANGASKTSRRLTAPTLNSQPASTNLLIFARTCTWWHRWCVCDCSRAGRLLSHLHSPSHVAA